MPISQPIEPPMKISTAILSLTIKPTANNAGEISPPKKKILFPLSNAVSRLPLSNPTKEIKPLKVPPTNAPFNIEDALSESVEFWPASRTEAQANPSGY